MPTSAAGFVVKIGTTHSSNAHHDLGEPADVRVLIDGRAVGEIGDRDEIVGADRAQELAHVGAAAQTAIARAAVRRARHADAIADLHAPHLGPHGFDDADAAVTLDHGHVVRCGACSAAARAPPGGGAACGGVGSGGGAKPSTAGTSV